MNKKIKTTKNWIVEHKTVLLVTALCVTTVVAVLERHGINQHNDFLKEHDLYEEFYTLSEDY